VSFPQDVPACYTPSSKGPAARTDATRHLCQTVIFAAGVLVVHRAGAHLAGPLVQVTGAGARRQLTIMFGALVFEVVLLVIGAALLST
jgi:hypothetical protein